MGGMGPDDKEFSVEDLEEFGKSSDDGEIDFTDELFGDDELFNDDEHNYQDDIDDMLNEELDVNDILNELKENKFDELENTTVTINNSDKAPEKKEGESVKEDDSRLLKIL